MVGDMNVLSRQLSLLLLFYSRLSLVCPNLTCSEREGEDGPQPLSLGDGTG